LNLPNKLTLFRIILIPIFVIVYYLPIKTTFSVLDLSIPLTNIIGTAIFAVAAYTDHLDGKIARKYNLITTFGKFMDPLADKLLVTSALLLAIELRLMPAFVPILIISREFMVTGIRLLAVTDGKVIAASYLGKAKTTTQIILIIVMFLFNLQAETTYMFFTQFDVYHLIVEILMVLATILTIVSGLDYLLKNKHIVFQTK